MKRLIVLITAIFLLLAVPVFAARKDIVAVGNASSYSVYYQEYQKNSTIRSDQETIFETKIGLRNSTPCTVVGVVDLNYTINEDKDWVVNTLSKIQLLNSTRHVLWDQANNTYIEGENITVRFNATEVLAYDCDSTYTVYYIRWHLTPLDDHRSVSITSEDYTYMENVTYSGADNVTVENVTLVYEPSKYDKRKSIDLVQYDGETVTNYTSEDDGIYFDPNIAADSTHWLYIKYTTIKGVSPHVPTVPTIPPTAPPVMAPEIIWIVIGLVASMAMAVFILFMLIYYYWK